MKKVVDANFLRDPALSVYIEEDPRNQVVFTDYACMECYKGNAIENIRRSLNIAAKYPDQVIVLKGTRDIIRPNQVGIPRSMILLIFSNLRSSENFVVGFKQH